MSNLSVIYLIDMVCSLTGPCWPNGLSQVWFYIFITIINLHYNDLFCSPRDTAANTALNFNQSSNIFFPRSGANEKKKERKKTIEKIYVW